MDQNQIPEDLAAVIGECWPDGIVSEFDLTESYFHDIRAALERDLQRISGASLRWQTDPQEENADWQSYHVFFLTPQGDEFEFEADTETTEEPDDASQPSTTTSTHGRGWYGCAVAVSLAASVTAISFDQFVEYEDGSESQPDLPGPAFDEETGAPIDMQAQYRDLLGEDAFARLDTLGGQIAAILEKHDLSLLDQSVLDLPVPELGFDDQVFLQPPLSVRDAFFFHGA